MAYELLALDDPPQLMENTQHTPKEEAQVPEAVPPLASHSEEVKQVPLYPLEAPQAELGKVTTLNTLRTLPSLSSWVSGEARTAGINNKSCHILTIS